VAKCRYHDGGIRPVEIAITGPNHPRSMSDEDLMARCGLYCGICAERAVLPRMSRDLLKLVHDEGYDDHFRDIPSIRDHYPSFVKVLEGLSQLDCRCRAGGDDGCPIRTCADRKGIRVCMECDEFPCAKWLALSEFHPMLVLDAEMYRKEGRERWLDVQRQRAAKGFHYGMVKMVQAGERKV